MQVNRRQFLMAASLVTLAPAVAVRPQRIIADGKPRPVEGLPGLSSLPMEKR
jgi:hypothetical protein